MCVYMEKSEKVCGRSTETSKWRGNEECYIFVATCRILTT